MTSILDLPFGNKTDSYKLTHHRLYPEGLERLTSYFEARGPADFSGDTCFFGLQYLLKAHLEGQVISDADLPRLAAFCENHFLGDDSLCNLKGWQHIIDEHGGKLPVSISAVPEGTVVPYSNALITIENTCPHCSWVTNFLETLLVQVWYPMTVASLSRSIKQTIHRFLSETAPDNLIPILLPSRLHDFGYRGVSSSESAAIGGAGHLVNFGGTDTIAAIELISQFYSGEMPGKDATLEEWRDFYANNMSGYSIPATEHSVMTLGGPKGEIDACRRVIEQFPSGFVACVSDSYDIRNCCSNIWGKELKDQVIARDGTLVVRPDSGDPPKMVVEVLNLLGEKFGFYTNNKGCKVLIDCVRVIQGDGISYRTVPEILQAMKDDGWSAENIAFGSGGALLQKLHRDTFACAFKACHSVINGKHVDVFKKPVTDSTKDSKKGRLALIRDADGHYRTVPADQSDNFPGGNQLVEVFRNGELVNPCTFKEIRSRAELPELAAEMAV